jgi:tryptophanyl-tRNA synthetase
VRLPPLQVARVFIRRKQAAEVQQVYAAAVADGVELKEEFVEEVQQWLEQGQRRPGA